MENWDIHKENVQPLPQGRKINELDKFLTTSPNKDEIENREKIRREFEDQLRSDNDDLLAVWYDYINWVEQNYPEGGEEANLKKLIENCISELFSNKKYHQDERFFRIFLRYTRFVTDAIELFDIMFKSNIFTSIASFYINWANVIEKNLTKAEEIIRIGLDKLAQPRIQLDLALKQIQLIASENKDKESSDEEDVRKPFVPLKVEKKKSGRAFAPVERLGNYEQNNYKLNNQQQKTSNVQVKIFTDENGDIASINQREIVKKLPTTNNQENVTKPGRWCDNKIISKPRLDQPVQDKFEIYDKEEDNDEKNNDKLKSTNQHANANKLKEIKKEEEPRLAIFEKLAPNQRFFCDLKKMYCGGTEYSFEEIRSIRIKLYKKKEEERSTKEKLKQEIENLKKQISQKDNLYNDVEQMKNKLENLLEKQSNNPKSKLITHNNEEIGTNFENLNYKQNTINCNKKKSDPIEQHCTTEKQYKFDNGNSPFKNLAMKQKDECNYHDNFKFGQVQNIKAASQNSPQLIKTNKEDLTIVRNLFNGTIEDEHTIDFDEKEIIEKPQLNDFSIFKDDDELNNQQFRQQFNQKQFNPQQYVNQFENANTLVLPHGDLDFIANSKHASTPAHFLLNPQADSTTIDENCTINAFQRENKFLSPIVETSKEYKSSSSSLSSYSSYHKSKTFHK